VLKSFKVTSGLMSAKGGLMMGTKRWELSPAGTRFELVGRKRFLSVRQDRVHHNNERLKDWHGLLVFIS